MSKIFTKMWGGQISLVASLVLAFLLLLPSQGWAQEDEVKTDPTTGFKYTTDGEGTATIVGYDQSVASSTSGDVVIPYFIKGANSYGEMNYHVTQFGDGQNSVFENGYISGKISFEASESTEITIKTNSFQYTRCNVLELPSSSLVKIEEDALNQIYANCITFTLAEPTLGYVSFGGYYHKYMFGHNFNGIQKIVIPGWNDAYRQILYKAESIVSVSGSGPTSAEIYEHKVELNEDNHTATITGMADGYPAQGNLYIPRTLSYNGSDYTVTSIAAEAFKGNSFSSITIPSTVTSIGENAFAKSKGYAWEDGYPAELYVYLNYSEDDLTKYATDAFSSFAGDLLAIIVPSSNGEAYKTHFSDIADNIYITRTDGNISDDKIFDKGYFTEGGLTYTRQLTDAEQQRGYVTCSLPFGIYPKDESYKNMFEAIYVVDNTIVKKSDGRYYLDPKDKMTSVGDYNPVYQPMLLKLKAGVSVIKFKNSSPRLITGDKYEEFSTALTVKDEQGNTLKDYTMKLCGSKELKTDCSDIYSFNPDGTFGKHKFDTLKPFRMYLKVTAKNGNSANSPVFYSSINPNGGTTGINAAHTDAAQKSALIYSIDGKLVSSNGSTAGLAKGVYIQNGKKVVVK